MLHWLPRRDSARAAAATGAPVTAIREALRCPMKHLIRRDDCRYCRDLRAALAELEALEAVAEAARAMTRPDCTRTNLGAFKDRTIDALNALDDLRLAAVQDGQTPRGGASGNDGTAGIATPDGCAERQSRPGVPRGVCSCPAGSYNPGVHEDYCPHAAEDTR